MAEEILSRDATAAIVGGLFRDLATGGSGRLPQLGTFVAGWSSAKGLERLVCGQPVDPLGFAANTLVLVVGIKGGATNLTIPSMPTGVQTILGPGGSAALRVTATQAIAVVIPTAKLAGAVAGQPGVLVLMAQEGQGSGGGGEKLPLFDQEDIQYSKEFVKRLKDRKISEADALKAFKEGDLYTDLRDMEPIIYDARRKITIIVDKWQKKAITLWGKEDPKRHWKKGWPDDVMWWR